MVSAFGAPNFSPTDDTTHSRLAEAARASEAEGILSRRDLEMEIGRLKGELQEVWKLLLPSRCTKLSYSNRGWIPGSD